MIVHGTMLQEVVDTLPQSPSDADVRAHCGAIEWWFKNMGIKLKGDMAVCYDRAGGKFLVELVNGEFFSLYPVRSNAK